MENITGLMSAGTSENSKSSPLLAQFRAALSPSGGAPRTLEQRLAELSDAERKSLIQTAKLVQTGLRMRVASNDYSMGYLDMVNTMYGGMATDKQQLIALLLEATDPLDYTPQPSPQSSAQERSMAFYDRPEFNIPSAATEADDASAAALEAAITGALPAPTQQPKTPTTFANKDEFLVAMTPVAKEVASDLGISHKIVLAQAALESGWSKSVRSNNLMGIKSHGEKGGVDVVTHEIVNGKKVKITDSFKQYESPEDSIRGYGAFLKANSRYKHFLRAGAENEDAQLSALQTSGYATDPQYSYKLAMIIKGLPKDDQAGSTKS